LEQTWLNPDFAVDQIVRVVTIILVTLVVLPALLGALVYAVLTLFARMQDFRRAHSTESKE
jgi:hypothetical protein